MSTSSPNIDVPETTPGIREGYQKLVNIEQGGDTKGGQKVVVYVPDTRRKRSPEAEARALARARIKEEYKSAALAEELKMTKKQRNKLVDNLAKSGVVSSVTIPSTGPTSSSANILSGIPKTYIASSKTNSNIGQLTDYLPPTETNMSISSNKRPFNQRINYSAPIGPQLNMSPGRMYNQPIGPLPASGMGGFQERPFNQRMNYSAPIGPQMNMSPGRMYNQPIGPQMNMSPGRMYNQPIGPLPASGMGGFQERPFNQRMNYSAPIGPQMNMSPGRMYNQPAGPLPAPGMGGFQERPFNQRMNYSAPIGPQQRQNMSAGRMYNQPIGPPPASNAGGFQERPFNQRVNYSVPIGPRERPRNSSRAQEQNYGNESEVAEWRAPSVTPRQVQSARQERDMTEDTRRYVSAPIVGKQPSGTVAQTGERLWEKTFGKYRMGMNIIYINKIYKQLRSKSLKNPEKLKELDKAFADAKTDPRLSIRGPLNLKPEQILPGKTLKDVEELYKKKREKAVAGGKTQYVVALDSAIEMRRKQFGGSSSVIQGKTARPSATPQMTPRTLSSEREAEMLLPGKTEDAVKRIYANRKTKAMKKGDKELASKLDKALQIRLQRIKSQTANVFKVSPERLIPGTTLAEIETQYKQRRSLAQKKGRKALVEALDRAIVVRRKQLGASPGKSPTPSPTRSPTGKTPLPTSPEREAEKLLPGKTEQAVRKIHANRRAAAVKKGDTRMASELDRLLPIRLQRIKTQGANVFKVPPERLVPGGTLAEVEMQYKQRRALAQKKGRKALVEALDRAVAVRRTQLGASPGKSPIQQGKSPIQQGKSPIQQGKSPIQQGKSPAMVKKKFAGLKNVPPEVLIPGKNLKTVEEEYKRRRAAAVTKGRNPLVEALNKAIPLRRRQAAGTPGFKQLVPSKTQIKTPSPVGNWRKVFGQVGVQSPNPRQVSEKYQAIRKTAKPEDVGKLNILFRKAIDDIKLIKRKEAEKGKNIEIKKIEQHKKEADKRKTDEIKNIEKQIQKVRKSLSKASMGATKASSNVQKFQRDLQIASQRRDQGKIIKFQRAAQRRSQDMERATTAKSRLENELRGLEMKLSQVRGSPPPKMLLSRQPSPILKKPLMLPAPQKIKSQLDKALEVKKQIPSFKKSLTPLQKPPIRQMRPRPPVRPKIQMRQRPQVRQSVRPPVRPRGRR